MILKLQIAHFIFKRWEPMHMRHVSALVVFTPLALSMLLMQSLGAFKAIYLTLAVYLSTLVGSVLLYRISPFRPLFRYPGPFACKLSKLWVGPLSFRGRAHAYIQRLHEKYGDVVCIGEYA